MTRRDTGYGRYLRHEAGNNQRLLFFQRYILIIFSICWKRWKIKPLLGCGCEVLFLLDHSLCLRTWLTSCESKERQDATAPGLTSLLLKVGMRNP